MSAILRSYQRQLAVRPIITQCWSAGILFIAGDVIAQQAVERKGWQYQDWLRTTRMAAYGTFVAGPLAIVWYRALENVPGTTPARAALARVVCDQVIAAPFMTVLFYTLQTAMAGGSLDDIKTKLQQNLWPTLKSNYAIWPAVQWVNFRYIPLNYRPLFVNSVAIGWNAYLSQMQNDKHPSL